MASEWLGEMFEGDSADTLAGKFPLVFMSCIPILTHLKDELTFPQLHRTIEITIGPSEVLGTSGAILVGHYFCRTKVKQIIAKPTAITVDHFKNCDTVTVAGEECLHLIYPLTSPQLYFTFVDCYFFNQQVFII